MSNQAMIKAIGQPEDAVIADTTKMINNNSLMAMVKTMAQRQMRVSIKSSLALDGGSVADVFTITTGYVLIYAMVMFITEAVSNNACNMAWGIDATTGAADIPVGANVDIADTSIGSAIYAEGDATALVIADQATKPALACITPIFAPPGGIDVDLANSNPTTGIADFVIQYRPLTADAYIVAN